MMTEKAAKPFTPRQKKIFSVFIKSISKTNSWLYRLSGGKIGGRLPQGAPIMLLTTIGRKSGQPRTAPLLYLREGDNIVVVASKGGMSHHPLWYRNLEMNPNVEVEIGS